MEWLMDIPPAVCWWAVVICTIVAFVCGSVLVDRMVKEDFDDLLDAWIEEDRKSCGIEE